MPTSFFTATSEFHRGNLLHTHSAQSDGDLDPEEVCSRYQAEGYDFIALTDHFIEQFNYPITDTTACRNEDFTTILGAELHTGATENGNLRHIVAVGLSSDFTPPHAPYFKPVEGLESAVNLAQRARENTPEALLNALKAGQFYSSLGPEIRDIRTTKQTVEIDCSSVVTIVVQGQGTATATPRGEKMTIGRLSLHRLANSPWIRISIIDHVGKRAWSNPIWVDH